MTNAQIVFLKAPFIQYEQILLTKNFRQYLETIMLLSKVLRMGIQKTPYQKTYELQMGPEEFTVDFKGCKRQSDWLEISLVYDKSDKHLTIYNSYTAECTAKMINVSSSQTFPTPTAQFDTLNDNQKHMSWKQYVAWHCDEYSTAPISNYINDPVFQELLLELDHFGNKSDKKVYIDLQDSLRYTNEIEKPSRNDSKLTVMTELKNALTHKMRL